MPINRAFTCCTNCTNTNSELPRSSDFSATLLPSRPCYGKTRDPARRPEPFCPALSPPAPAKNDGGGGGNALSLLGHARRVPSVGSNDKARAPSFCKKIERWEVRGERGPAASFGLSPLLPSRRGKRGWAWLETAFSPIFMRNLPPSPPHPPRRHAEKQGRNIQGRRIRKKTTLFLSN